MNFDEEAKALMAYVDYWRGSINNDSHAKIAAALRTAAQSAVEDYKKSLAPEDEAVMRAVRFFESASAKGMDVFTDSIVADGKTLVVAYHSERAKRVEAENHLGESTDMVPRARYDVACDQYNEAERLRKEQFQKAQEAYIKAEKSEARVKELESEERRCIDARLEAAERRCAEMVEKAAMTAQCLTSQLPGFSGGCSDDGMNPCACCLAAARIRALQPKEVK